MRYQGQNFCDFEFLWKGNGVQSCFFRIPHNTLSLPPKFCINICFQMFLRIRHFPKSINFEDHNLYKISGENRVYYGRFENRELGCVKYPCE